MDEEHSANHITVSTTDGDNHLSNDEDIVFTECSKRIHYSNSNGTTTQAHQMFDGCEEQKARSIKAGSIEKLVEYLAPVCDDPDPSYTSCFLLTYRTFLTPERLLNLLTARYLETSSSQEYTTEQKLKILKNLVSFLKLWLDKCPGDFDNHPCYERLDQLQLFAHKHFRDNNREVATKCERMKKRFLSLRISLSNDFDIDPRDELSFPTFNLFSMDAVHLAQQLTDLAADLFCKVVPHECLHYIMNQKSRDLRQQTAPTVCATIEQFNKVSLAVIATVLQATDNSNVHCVHQRGKTLARWIEVAQHCRRLKNFSSIKAILAGLQSSSLHRMKKTWSHVPPETVGLFDELSSLFAADSNSQVSREVLDKEGTAKYATVERKKSKSPGNQAVVIGVVPWLGTFMHDLVMIDSAYDDHTAEGYINFDKCRRFFEVLAKITLYQKAAANYHLTSDAAVKHWLANIQSYSDKESYELSKVLEPNITGSDSPQVPSFKKKIRNLFSTKGSDEFTLPFTPPPSSPSRSPKLLPSSLNHCRGSLSPVGSPQQITNSSRSSSNNNLSCSPSSSDTRVIRVRLDTSNDCMYKSLLLKESYRTADVIRIALEKLGFEQDPDKYNLVQILAKNKQLIIPDKSNVYWAMNTEPESLQFILQLKS